jgi:type I restriction enzyme, R subunit
VAFTNFIFLKSDFPILFNIGQSAEYNLHSDPEICLIKLRQFGERLTDLMFDEHGLNFPQENNFHSRIKTLEFERLLPIAVKDLLFAIKEKGNIAVHQNRGTAADARHTLFSAFKVAKWFYETYAQNANDISGLKFHMPEQVDTNQALKDLEIQYKALEEKFAQLLAEREAKGISEEKRQDIQDRSAKAARKIEWTEAETRELIDAQLRKGGWEADTETLNYKLHKTSPRKGRNIAIAEWPVTGGWADYALFIGTELYGFVEAKKYGYDISQDLRQSKIYAESVTNTHDISLLGKWDRYLVPFLFATNGREYLEQIKTKSGIWFLDVRHQYNTSRPLQGWYSPEGLKKLLKSDVQEANKKLEDSSLHFMESPSGLGLRKYQIKAIRAVEEKIITQPQERRSLIAMATGTGKTRTVIGLCYHLIQTARFKRILFLVDRTLLGTQAINAFKDNKIADLNTFAGIYDVKGLQTAIPDVDTRLHFATVQGMVKRLFYNDDSKDIPTVDQYDCIIIDEAHRGYLLDKELDEEELHFKNQQDYVSKYRKVLDYFDAYAIGLTATPALHTKEIFGSPVYTYSYREAVVDGYLIDHDPPYIIKTKLSEEGIVWEKGEKPKAYDKETNSIIELGELEDELAIDVAGFNKLVLSENFNQTVICQLVKELDPEGAAKTLIFAATDSHADTVVGMLKEEFQNIGIDVSDEAIQKITGKSYDPQELLTRFKNEQYPNIAVTVDLLTTGIDVPPISNLVFMRRVKSRILYEQMLGRATRLCEEIGKETFRIFDAVRIYETLEDYTQMKPVVANPKATFQQLAEEIKVIDSNERAKKQLEQIIAKLQRKKKYVRKEGEEHFRFYSGGADPESFIDLLKSGSIAESVQTIIHKTGLWRYLDELKGDPAVLFVSEHEDQYIATERGYGKGKKPEDYLENFAEYIRANQNKIAALQVICTRPKELTREALRELLLVLDSEGYNALKLNTAWKATKNQDIAADVISYIRTLAVGNALISHKERITRAVSKVKGMGNWNAVQVKWLDRIEKQLLKETVLQPEDFDKDPFSLDGGYKRFNRIFDNKLSIIIETINENLYIQTA